MDSQFFFNTGGLPWRSLTPAMETHVNDLNSLDCFFNSNFETNSTDQSPCFQSALSSIVSSPSNCNNMVNDNGLLINELIGKLGNISNDSGEISRRNVLAWSTNTSCYSTPLNSPPKKPYLPVMDQVPNHPSLAELAADPGFIERAARFSSFGSRSFNGRSNQIGLNNVKSLTGNAELPRVGSSPSLNAMTTQIGSSMTSPLQDLSELGNSSQESMVSEQTPTIKASVESNSKKRKAASKGKAKQPSNARKEPETNDNSDSKRAKPNEGNADEKIPLKTEDETKGTEEEKQNKTNNAKPPEPPKDYIHVRARRGQATDSHSLAERVRREKISERMKLLQDLVPGCNKVTGKAMVLDEIINYVQALQRQVEFLSMKLASVNTNLEFNIDTLAYKDVIQSNPALQQQMLTLDTSIFGHQPHQNSVLQHANICNETLTKASMDPLDSALCQHLNVQLHPVLGFNQPLPQYPTSGEDELQSIVQMGFVPKP